MDRNGISVTSSHNMKAQYLRHVMFYAKIFGVALDFIAT